MSQLPWSYAVLNKVMSSKLGFLYLILKCVILTTINHLVSFKLTFALKKTPGQFFCYFIFPMNGPYGPAEGTVWLIVDVVCDN